LNPGHLYRTGAEWLQASGYRKDTVQAGRRSASDDNARVIDEAVATISVVTGEPMILLGEVDFLLMSFVR
jgi:hypothetical protein